MAVHTKNCKECGKTYTASRSDSVFCSASCRTKWNRKRKDTKTSKQEGFAEVKKQSIPEVRKQSIPEVRKEVAPVDTLDLILQELRQITSLLDDHAARNERLLTVEDALKELDISKRTFERMQSEGLIKLHRFGGKDKGRGRGRKPYVKYSELIKALKT